MKIDLESILRSIVEKLTVLNSPKKAHVEKIKLEVCREHKLSKIPPNSELIKVLKPYEKNTILPILRKKDTRTISGVNVVAVMTQPRACPHGRCVYCPGGPDDGVPQSYTGHEPASMRGAQNNYDPYLQVKNRIKQLRIIGHDVDKVDLIIMGGTFPSAPKLYQKWFVKRCLDAMNSKSTKSLKEAKNLAGSAGIRNVGITVETRPDYARKEDINNMLNLGVTRVELGVQNIYDDIYKLVERSHKVQDVIDVTKLMKDSGLKICYHLMPGLPSSNFKRDFEGFKTIFHDSQFKPDMLKIYPTLVIKDTKLYEWWKSGDYKPYTTEEAIELIAKVKEIVPPWIRIMRIQRDIPSHLIVAGVEKSNLRQLVQNYLRERGGNCRCIRCREVGHTDRDIKDVNDFELKIERYEASEGLEFFLSIENNESILVGSLRLRIPSSNTYRPEIRNSSAIIRELHIYGRLIPVGFRKPEGWQHKGWGSLLLSEAERIVFEDYDITKILVTSALGTKEYYKKFGYSNDGVYMSKHI